MSDASKKRGTIAVKRLDSLSTKVQQYKNKLRHSESMTEVPNKESTSNQYAKHKRENNGHISGYD